MMEPRVRVLPFYGDSADYEGTCPRCGRLYRSRLTRITDEVDVVPPPTLPVACRCAIPVTSFKAVYIGRGVFK